jgi:DNA polymerase-1
MKTLSHTVAGSVCQIFIPETSEDAANFEAWMAAHAREPLAIDTETTGLAVFSANFKLRLVQIGNGQDAWVLDAQKFGPWVASAVRRHSTFVAHNYAFDAQVLDKALGLTIEEMTSKVFDTVILSKLIEPHRANHKLKPLSTEYVDASAEDTQEGLTARFRELGFTKETGWAGVPITDELYLRYAGLDVIYTARLLPVLVAKVRALQLAHLVEFEQTVQGFLNIMRRKGLRVDLAYARAQQQVFLQESAEHLAIARNEFGLDNLNSPAQVQAALLASGAVLTERTPSGAFKVGKEVLLPLAGMDEYWGDIEDFENPNALAMHIAKGKRAERFGNAYLGKFINLADPNGYIHPNITGLEARTSRSAVSDPPLQQLPSKDWKVRRAILADEGSLIISTDYAQIEFRILAMLADVKRMKEAILQGIDLHDYTAELAYGPSFTKANRTHMKGAGFGVAYGGGAAGLSRKMGISVSQATAVVQAYNRVYPEIKRWSAKLQREARSNKMVMRSRTGRILTLDRDRVYAALNYQIQSTAADVLKNALEGLFNAGLGAHLLMPVHDEIIAQASAKDAQEVARTIGEIMTKVGTEMFAGLEGLPLDAEGEVYGKSWGHGYGTRESMGRWY